MAFGRIYNSNNEDFCLYITIKLKPGEKKRFRVWAEEYEKRNSKYADREIKVEGERQIYFSFPVSPKRMFIGILNCDNQQDEDFEVTLMKAPLKTYSITIDDQTRRFLKLAVRFSQVAGYEAATYDGRLFATQPEEFRIKYFDNIRDRMSGQSLNTPARIGHETGIIEVSKAKFDRYTVPMRLIILLHEYSHKYRNPKIGLPISNEYGADVNAMYYYLGMGYSKIDAIVVFAKVFLVAQTPQNQKRMRNIMDYIQKFGQGEFASLN